MLRFHRFALSLGASALVALAFACSSTPAAKSDKLCTPGAYVFCRCQDKSEGAKLCKEDGVSFEPCDPCESLGLGEDPDPGEPPTDFDGGVPARCGDGIAQDDEDCDDKNPEDTDGCTKDCKLSAITPSNGAGDRSRTCPGLDVHVWGGAHKPTTTGTTLSSSAHTSTPNCDQAGGNTSGGLGNDRVFKVTAHKTGQMTVRATDVSYDAFLYVSEECPVLDAGSGNVPIPQFACANAAGIGGGETLSFPVDTGKTYYVFVDGAGLTNPNGTFRVTFEIP